MLGYDIFIDEKLRPHLIGVLNCMSWCGASFDEDELWRIFILGDQFYFKFYILVLLLTPAL